MHEVAVFPGLWHDIKLGNWAKHLAAHIDEQIVTYWRHIYRVWNDVIFNGVDPSLRQSVDASSARFLQFLAPAWSEKDQEAIRERMKNGTLFCNISNEEDRARLLRNLLAFEGIIPSVLTFHENMRYLTIGAKILEKYIEVKRPTEKAKPELAPLKTPESLLGNLEQDWGKHCPVLNLVECKEGLYQTMQTPLQAQGAFVQLMLAALRSFPFLSSEAPLQDIKGIGMNAFVDDMSRSRLCKMASAMGFWNKKIEKGLKLPNQDVQREIPDIIVFTEGIWRGGLPTISVFRDLRTKSFLPSLALAGKDVKGKEPNAALIQFDFVCAFFGRFDLNVDQSSAGLSIEDLRNPIFDSSAIVPIVSDDSEPMTDAPSLDVTTNVDWAEESVAFTSEALAAATNQPPSARRKGQTPRKQKDHGPLTRKPERAIAKAKPNTKLSKEAKEKAKKMAKEPLRLFGGEAPILPVPVGMDVDELDVPEAHQRISAPTFDGLDTSQQGRPQQPLVEPHIEAPAEARAETPVRPLATSEIEPEVPESHQRISAPNVDGYDMLVNLLGEQPQKQPQKQPQEQPQKQPQEQPQIILQDPDEEAEQRHQQRKKEALELQKQLEEEQQQRPSRLPRAKPYSRLEKDKPSKAMIEIRKHHNDEEPEPNKRQRIDDNELEIPHRPEARPEGINPYEEEEW
ncbi:DUF3723 domain protein [Fusarium beomiforme]|uniref:DUF3723 domain protein n=1 Tax=Fusarium beomiforme TaxID=44412 RepID=A0A9P5AQ75_9HYPO|nr:DUF3723 domain protein [Fusarium beomiforme]